MRCRWTKRWTGRTRSSSSDSHQQRIRRGRSVTPDAARWLSWLSLRTAGSPSGLISRWKSETTSIRALSSSSVRRLSIKCAIYSPIWRCQFKGGGYSSMKFHWRLIVFRPERRRSRNCRHSSDQPSLLKLSRRKHLWSGSLQRTISARYGLQTAARHRH